MAFHYAPTVLGTNQIQIDQPPIFMPAPFLSGIFPFSLTIQCTGHSCKKPFLPFQYGDWKGKFVLSSDFLPARGGLVTPLSSMRHKKLLLLETSCPEKHFSYLLEGNRLAPTFLLSIFLPWIQMWSLEVHGLLVTRKWWHLRARAREQSPSNWAVDCVPAAAHLLSLTKKEKLTPHLSCCESGFLLLAIKSIFNWCNHPH